jgi:hypothetical protein
LSRKQQGFTQRSKVNHKPSTIKAVARKAPEMGFMLQIEELSKSKNGWMSPVRYSRDSTRIENFSISQHRIDPSGFKNQAWVRKISECEDFPICTNAHNWKHPFDFKMYAGLPLNPPISLAGISFPPLS